MKNLFFVMIALIISATMNAQVYVPTITLTDLGGNQWEVKVQVELPANETGSITNNYVTGDTREIEVTVSEGVPINGTHIEEYQVTIIQKSPSETQVRAEVSKSPPKKKKGEAIVLYSGQP